MAELFVIMAICAGFHFIYESTIAPSLRTKLRFQLFAQRDKVRMLKIQHPEKFSDSLFSGLENRLSNFIYFLPMFSISSIFSPSFQVKTDIGAELASNKFLKELYSSEVPKLKETYDRTMLLLLRAMLINAGGWVLIILAISPLVIIAILILLMAKSLSDTKKWLVRKLTSIDASEYDYSDRDLELC